MTFLDRSNSKADLTLFTVFFANLSTFSIVFLDMMSDKKHDKPSEGNYMLQSLLACEEVRSQLISLVSLQII